MQLPLNSPPWHLADSVGTRLITDVGAAELRVDWPLEGGGRSLNALLYRGHIALTQFKQVVAAGNITGQSAEFISLDGPRADVRVRLYMFGMDGNRYYSAMFFVPLLGQIVLSVDIVPSSWTDVAGHSGAAHPLRWANTFRRCANIGFCFGGMFAEHGQVISNNPGARATFHLTSFELS